MPTRLLIPILLSLEAINLGCMTIRPLRFTTPENAIVFQPGLPEADDWEPPGLTYEDVWIDSTNGVRLHAWYCPVDNPRAYVLFAHGNAGTIASRWPVMEMLTQQLGVTALVFDYRGYGRSTGQPSERGVLDDARAARDWFANRVGVSPQDIVLYGESLGGGVVVDLAAKDGARGLMLESTFTSLPDVARNAFPYIPVALLMRNDFDSISKIASYRGPLIIAHGNDDPLIPIEQGKQLFRAANEPKRFYAVPEAGHNWDPTREYVNLLDKFISELPPRGTSSPQSKELPGTTVTVPN